MEENNVKHVIRYKLHWCGPCEKYGDTKEETAIYPDGFIVGRRFDHHGPNGRFRLIEKGTGTASVEETENLDEQLMDIVRHHEGAVMLVDDTESKISIEGRGIRITIDGGLTDDKQQIARELVDVFLSHVEITWESV